MVEGTEVEEEEEVGGEREREHIPAKAQSELLKKRPTKFQKFF